MTKVPAPVKVVFVGAPSLTVGWHVLVSTFSRSWCDDRYTHILLILPVAMTLMYLDWPTVSSRVESHLGWGFILLGLAVLVPTYARLRPAALASDMQLSIDMIALLIWWIGAFILCIGVRITRSLFFSICFLFWLVPIPSFPLTRIVQGLQQGSAVTAWLLFSAVGVPAARNGVLVSIPGLTVEVAKECSSIRSSLMLLVITMVLAHVLLKTFWRKTLLTLSAIPLSVVKNGLRIFTIAMLGTRVDRGFLAGHLHHDGGIVFFLLALLAMGFVLILLRKGERAMLEAPITTVRTNRIPGLAIGGSSN